MSSATELPTNWSLHAERTTRNMGREYTTVRYTRTDGTDSVYIRDVIDGDDTWQFEVSHSGRDRYLGVAADLASAKALAMTYIQDVDSD
jgi:hypothetical protein